MEMSHWENWIVAKQYIVNITTYFPHQLCIMLYIKSKKN
jgi:hypothetical protein